MGSMNWTMKEKKSLNKREEKIMEALWSQPEAVTITEIEELFADEKISKASIFKAVQSLVKQGYVNISGVELIKKTYARKLEPAISREEYAAIMLMERGITRSSLGEIALAMTGSDKNGKKDKEEDEQLIKELEGIIAKLRGQEK